MLFPIFILKNDWFSETNFLGKSKRELVFHKGKEFTSEDGLYYIEWPGGVLEYNVEEMRQLNDDGLSIFEELIRQEISMSVEEISEDDEEIIRNWRIQLDVKTSRKKLKEVENFMRKTISEMI